LRGGTAWGRNFLVGVDGGKGKMCRKAPDVGGNWNVSNFSKFKIQKMGQMNWNGINFSSN
jgi:hypothetical protein